MIFDLEEKEINLTAGGRQLVCHFTTAIKKGLELGGMVLCLSVKRVGSYGLTLEQVSTDTPSTKKQIMAKIACGFVIGFSVEMVTHATEMSTGVDC